MRDKKSIIKEIRQEYGNLLNLRKTAAALGFKDVRAAQGFLEGIPYVQMGKEKKYLASDIGARIWAHMTPAE